MSKIIKERPVVVRTDRQELRLYFNEGAMRVHSLQIRHGEIVPSKAPVFTLRASDFHGYPDTLKALIELVTSMGGKRA